MSKAKWYGIIARAGGFKRKRDYVNWNVRAVKAGKKLSELDGPQPKPTANPQGQFKIVKGQLIDEQGNVVGDLWG